MHIVVYICFSCLLWSICCNSEVDLNLRASVQIQGDVDYHVQHQSLQHQSLHLDHIKACNNKSSEKYIIVCSISKRTKEKKFPVSCQTRNCCSNPKNQSQISSLTTSVSHDSDPLDFAYCFLIWLPISVDKKMIHEKSH